MRLSLQPCAPLRGNKPCSEQDRRGLLLSNACVSDRTRTPKKRAAFHLEAQKAGRRSGGGKFDGACGYKEALSPRGRGPFYPSPRPFHPGSCSQALGFNDRRGWGDPPASYRCTRRPAEAFGAELPSHAPSALCSQARVKEEIPRALGHSPQLLQGGRCHRARRQLVPRAWALAATFEKVTIQAGLWQRSPAPLTLSLPASQSPRGAPRRPRPSSPRLANEEAAAAASPYTALPPPPGQALRPRVGFRSSSVAASCVVRP